MAKQRAEGKGFLLGLMMVPVPVCAWPGLELCDRLFSRIMSCHPFKIPLIHPSSSPHTHWENASRATKAAARTYTRPSQTHPPTCCVLCAVVGWRLCRCHDTKQDMEATRMDLDASLLEGSSSSLERGRQLDLQSIPGIASHYAPSSCRAKERPAKARCCMCRVQLFSYSNSLLICSAPTSASSASGVV